MGSVIDNSGFIAQVENASSVDVRGGMNMEDAKTGTTTGSMIRQGVRKSVMIRRSVLFIF